MRLAQAASASGMAAISSRTRSAARTECRVAGHLRDGGRDRLDRVVLRGDEQPGAGTDQERGVLRLVGPARQGNLRHAVHETAQHRARPAVRDQQVGPFEDSGLGHELRDHGIRG